MAPRSTTAATTASKSNKKLAPVKDRFSTSSKIGYGRSMEADMVPAAASIHKETSGSKKLKDPQINPSRFGGSTSAIAKPSSLRMPSPSVGFFNQENAQMSHGNGADRNVGKFSARSTPSLAKPPRYKQLEDLKAGLHLSKVLSTNGTTDSNLASLPVTTDSSTNTAVTSEKRSLSKIISTYSTKSRDTNYKERQEVYCSLAGSGDATKPLSSEKNDGGTNIVPIDTKLVEERGIIKEVEPVENSLSIKATSFSTIEATCSPSKPSVGSKLSPSCIPSQTNDLSCQSKTHSGSIGTTDLGERALPISLSEDGSSTLVIDSSRNSDSCDHNNTECSTSVETMEYTLCVDHLPPSGSPSDAKPAVADRKSVSNDSPYDEGEYALSEGPNSDDRTELETNEASAVTECNHSFKRTKCSPVKLEAPTICVERQSVSSVELNMGDKMEFGTSCRLRMVHHVERSIRQ